jgi:uncharacterized protein (TIGR00255 family)
MTAYAQAAENTPLGELSCELRSVNHRYLEISPRMPEELRALEQDLREVISSRLKRGRVDCFVRLQSGLEGGQSLELNTELVGQLGKLAADLNEVLPGLESLRAVDILRWPDIVQAPEVDLDQMRTHLLSALDSALDGMVDARGREGAKLADLIKQRLESISKIVLEVRGFLPEIQQEHQERIESRLAELKGQLDPGRLEQEMVLFLHKSDVLEELDRLTVHVEEVHDVLKTDAAIGRKLDFLMQELNREANTLGSKSHDPRMTQASVELKVLIEQIREQVQNIE